MRTSSISLWCYVAIFLSCILIPYIVANSCKGKPNPSPVIEGVPRLLNTTKNGKKFIVGSGSSQIYIVHVYGTPYEMGYAYGTLMKNELKDQFAEYYAYLEKMIEQYIQRVPSFLRHYVAQFGLKAALDFNWEITRQYTPARYTEEMNGMADGAGIDMRDIRRMNLLPELIKAGCSIIGANGESTSSKSLFQVRALDWDYQAPINKYPVITVYHPTEANSTVFANVAYAGFVGTITGFSNASIGISEKVWITEEKDITTRFGKPWNYVLRDAMQFGRTVEDVLQSFKDAKRTCAIHVGVGDSSNEFRGVQYSWKELNIYNWDSQQLISDEHPLINGVFYWDKHVQPSHDRCLGELLLENYGNLNSETLLQTVIPMETTGDTQVAIFDFKNKVMHVSYSAYGDVTPKEAYLRPYVRLEMERLFNERQ